MIDKQELSFLYKSLTFLDKLSKQQQNEIINNLKKIKYKESENLHGGLKHCAGVIIVKSGRLRVYLLSESGREITLFFIEEGESCVLSASCAINNITFDVHIDSEGDSEILLLGLNLIENIGDNIYLENFLLNEAVLRFSEVMWAIEKILFLKIDQRLAVFLLDEISRNNSDTIYRTHEEIGRHLGSAREVISRMLKYFVEEGWVKLLRGEIEVVDKVALRALININQSLD